jgi:hypothetical protein
VRLFLGCLLLLWANPGFSQEIEAGQVNAPPPEPKRILDVVPNYPAVSSGVIPPPPGPAEAFKIATENSFDYSSFLLSGINSLLAEQRHANPELGSGASAFGRYYWRSVADKTINNYVVLFALPTLFHEDERYYAKGKGGVWKRSFYAASRILVIPNYQEHNSFNASQVLGRAISEGISTTYSPISDRTAGKAAVHYGVDMGLDAVTNIFREFWPDIAARLRHHKR